MKRGLSQGLLSSELSKQRDLLKQSRSRMERIKGAEKQERDTLDLIEERIEDLSGALAMLQE